MPIKVGDGKPGVEIKGLVAKASVLSLPGVGRIEIWAEGWRQ
jgi:hypothetical protein